MNKRRRRFLCCLGASGVASVTGCLRLEQNRSTAEEEESPSASRSSGPALSVSVIGRNFSWGFAYPEFDVSNREELVLPVGKTVALEVTSEDVAHSFAVEEFEISVEALPDKQAKTTITPEKTGEYTAFCTEFCGAGHTDMKAPVRVVPEAEFESWRS